MSQTVLPTRTRRRVAPIAVMISGALLLAGLSPAVWSASSAKGPEDRPAKAQKLVVGPDEASTKPRMQPPGFEDRPARGMVYKGLGLSSKCPGGFVLEGTKGICTHGPDGPGGEHGPTGGIDTGQANGGHDHGTSEKASGGSASGVDVRQIPSTEELIEAAGELKPSATSSTGGQIPCYGDGTDGSRVQAVYAVASDVADRYGQLTDLFPTYAARADAVFANSAAAGGGVRHIRWVHTADCKLDVLHVVLSPTGDDSFSNTRTELRNLGLTRTDRKYMVWVDAGVYCGIANVSRDDQPGLTNANNRGPTFARVDARCWGSTNSVEAHEIAHTLGAVQLSAPNSNGAWHCTDEYDRMCYNDGSGATLRYVCASTWEARLDCNGDDYFNLNPPSGSYLAGHWNLASSYFLASTKPDAVSTVPTPTSSPTPTASSSPSPTASPTPTKSESSPTPTTSPTATASPTPTSTTTSPTGPAKKTTSFGGSLNKKQASRSFTLDVSEGEVTAELEYKRGPSMKVSLFDHQGALVASTSGVSVLRLDTGRLPAGRYTWVVDGATSGSFSLTVSYSQ